ncbi:MAG: ABC transporter permease subunit [Nocardioidaceae bacterium]
MTAASRPSPSLIALWVALAFAVVCLAVLLIDSFVDGSAAARLQPAHALLLAGHPRERRSACRHPRIHVGHRDHGRPRRSHSASPRPSTSRSSPNPRRWYNRLIEVNLQNLAAVPAIVYGMLTAGFALAVGLRRGIVLAAAIALALLILPVIIITTREALRAVPAEIRDGSLALGATPLQTVWRQTLPSAIPGIATGTILALSRALGEAAPLLLLGGLVFINYDPDGLFSGFTDPAHPDLRLDRSTSRMRSSKSLPRRSSCCWYSCSR